MLNFASSFRRCFALQTSSGRYMRSGIAVKTLLPLIMKTFTLTTFTLITLCPLAALAAAQYAGSPSGEGKPAATATKAITDSLASDSLQPPAYDMLDEVVVSVRKPVLQANGEKLTYNLDEDPASSSSSLLDMLRKVPSVTVDGQDKIQVNGQSNFKIYINGKEDPMLSSDPGRILKAMPASAVAKIEVINEPGAKYDAEGTAGILNFITARVQRNDGYAGSVQASVGTSDVQAGANARAKYRNVTGSIHLEFGDNHIHPESQDNRRTTDYLSSGLSLRGRNLQKYTWDYYGGGLDLSWEPDTLNLFTVNFSMNYMHAAVSQFDEDHTMLGADGSRLWHYKRSGSGFLNNLNLSAGASYQHTFGRRGHHLIASYLYSRGGQKLSLTRHYTEMNDYQGLLWNDLLTDNTTNEHTAQLDYALPIDGEKHLFEAGVKGLFRRNHALGHDNNGPLPDQITDLSLTDLDQKQDIGAAYASYTGTYGKVGVKAGLRYEHTRMGIYFRNGEEPDFNTRFNDLVPNAAVTYSFTPAHSLRLSYQMRISRPTLSQVNPFELKISNYEVQMGNPDLESERSNKLTLTYSNFGRKFGGNISLEYSQINNSIAQYIFTEDDVMYQTYGNLGRNRSTTLSGFLNYNITRKMRLTLNGRVQYNDLNAPNPRYSAENGSPRRLCSSGWTGNFGANFDYTMPWRLHLGAYGGKDWGFLGLSSKWNGWYYYGLSLSRSFLKNDALRIDLNAMNFLQSDISWKSSSWSESVREHSEGTRRAWRVSVGVSWNFGNLASQVKKTGANLSTDDASSSGSKQGGIM